MVAASSHGEKANIGTKKGRGDSDSGPSLPKMAVLLGNLSRDSEKLKNRNQNRTTSPENVLEKLLGSPGVPKFGNDGQTLLGVSAQESLHPPHRYLQPLLSVGENQEKE